MAKKVILDVLEQTIGRYVLNLDAESLNVAVWSGKIELNALELDTYSINDELDRQAAEAPNLAVPVRVIGGRFDSLTVDVPWTKITSQPVVFRAKGLNITITPNDYDQTHAHSHATKTTTNVQKDAEKKKTNLRQAAIDIADEARQRKNAIRDLAPDSDIEDHSSFASRLVRRIIENLQVDVEDIHVCMEGFGSSAGFVLESLSLVTTDENGVRTFVDRGNGKDSFLHKKLNITDFGIYMDNYYTFGSVSESKSDSDSSFLGSKKKRHSYILSPVSFEALLRQSSAHKCFKFPKYLVTSQLSNISITISRTQLEFANKLVQVLQPKQRLYLLFPEYRPTVPIRKGTTKLWWKYAVRCIGRLTRRRSWTEFFLAYLTRKQYIPLYKQATYAKTCAWIKPIANEEKLILNDIDMDTSISVAGIMGWRNIADAQVKKEAKVKLEKLTGYRAFFKYQEPGAMDENDLEYVPISLTIDEMKELEEINMEQIADSVLSTDSKLCDIKFELQSFRIDLLKSTLEPIAKFEMGQMVTNFDAKNDGSFNCSFTLSSMQVDDLITQRTLFPKIVQSLQSPSSPSFKYAFEFQLKKGKEEDQDIVIKLVAFQLVPSPQFMNEVKSFFTLDSPNNGIESSINLSNSELQKSLSSRSDIFSDAMDDINISATSVKSLMTDKLSSALSDFWNQKNVRKQTWTMDCDIDAPIIVIPDNVEDSNSAVLVVDMGNLHLMLEHNSSSKTLRKDSFSGNTFGNKIQFRAKQMQIYTGEGQTLDSPVQILEPVDMAFFLKTVFDEGSENVELKAVALTPIDMTFSTQNALLLNAVLSSISDSLVVSGRDEKNELPNKLSEDEENHLEHLSNSLRKIDNWDTDDCVSLGETNSSHFSLSPSSSGNLSSQRIGKLTKINLTIPGVTVTIINDLQGLDQPLFKIVADSVVGGGEVKVPFMNDTSSLFAAKKLTFDAHFNASLSADYFDTSTNLWAKFLQEPWELTIRSKRTKESKFNSQRFSALLDIEAHPCYISFSEQFVVSIGAAKQMWSMYSTATTNASSRGSNGDEDSTVVENMENINQSFIRKSLAANVARALVTTMPYGINNHTGFAVEFFLSGGEEMAPQKRQFCKTGQLKYFRFECPKVEGVGGKRVYGQDIKHPRTLEVFIEKTALHFPHIDSEVNKPRCVHKLDEGQLIFAEFVNTGRATILHLSSYIHVYNCTNIPFSIALQNNDGMNDVGVCHGKARSKLGSRKRKTISSNRSKHSDNMMSSKYSSSLGIPCNLLHNHMTSPDAFSGRTGLDLLFCPHISNEDFEYEKDEPPQASISFVNKRGAFRWGVFSFPFVSKLVESGSSNKLFESFEVVCSMPTDELSLRGVGNPIHNNQSDSMCFQLSMKITLVDKVHPFVEIFIQPRSILENKLPVSVLVRTSMPFTFSPPNDKGICSQSTFDFHEHVSHRLDPQQSLEIFSPGSSIAIKTMCADKPVAGGVTGWCEEIVDIPLGLNCKLINPIRCLFPLIEREGETRIGGGSDFYIMESEATIDEKGNQNTNEVQEPPLLVPENLIRTILITVQSFVIDHTGNVLFEPKDKNNALSKFDMPRKKSSSTTIEKIFLPWSAFSSMQKGRRVTLLPKSSTSIHLVDPTLKGNTGIRKSFPFEADGISICGGGPESSAIMWENKAMSGYFAYRQLRSFGQSEVHIIPEFVAFNGSTKNTIVVKQPECNLIVLGPEKIAPLTRDHLNKLIIIVEVLDISGSTEPIRVDTLGMKICVVKSHSTGIPLGSIAIQTVVGGKDSRLVIKIGAVEFGGKERISDDAQGHCENASLLADDFLRFRIRWTALKISLSDTQLASETGVIPITKNDPKAMDRQKKSDLVILELILQRLTIDFQRIFKEGESSSRQLQTPERSQLSVVVHNMRVLDCISEHQHLVVFDGFTNQNLFDLCIRFHGPMNAELVKVKLLDINIAYSKQTKADTIVLNTSEDFIWRLLDVFNRIMNAVNDLVKFQIVLDWNDKQGQFEVSIIETSDDEYSEDGNEVMYHPPQRDRLFDIKAAQVSPIRLQFSFQRQPQASRYSKRAGSAPGAKLMNYFTQQLKFTIQNANLKFPGYITRNMKGPIDHMILPFTTFYISRIKAQLLALMTAVSLQDWKYLTNREDGDDEFVEGDILRLTGNMAGRSVGYIFNKVGQGIGDGVSTLTSTLGNEFEKTTELIGAGAVGVRVNNLVSGVGDGIGNTVKGVGTGAGNIIRGAGRGVGQIAGGVGGGVQRVVKGNFKEGATAIGTGVGHGIETTVVGVTDGMINMGKGLFSGVESIGSGLEGVLMGKKRNSAMSSEKKK